MGFDHIFTEARRVPLRIALLKLGQRYRATFRLSGAAARDDVHVTAARLTADDLSNPNNDSEERS